MMVAERLAEGLVKGTLDAASFGHVEHVAAAYALLRELPFEQAAERYATGIRLLARNAGAPDKFNLTITLACLSLIGEQLATTTTTSFDAFAQAHPALLERSCLDTRYSPERLQSPIARSTFVLPDRNPAT